MQTEPTDTCDKSETASNWDIYDENLKNNPFGMHGEEGDDAGADAAAAAAAAGGAPAAAATGDAATVTGTVIVAAHHEGTGAATGASTGGSMLSHTMNDTSTGGLPTFLQVRTIPSPSLSLCLPRD